MSVEIAAREVIGRCRMLATYSEERGFTTRTFLAECMRNVHADLTAWMSAAGMDVRVDSAGNLRGVYAGAAGATKRLLIGSHLDTVPHAGAFDGVLGVGIGVSLVESLHGRRLPFGIEVIGFSDEEGVRFGVPFIGSRALVGNLDESVLATKDAAGISIREAIAHFGLNPAHLDDARASPEVLGYIEFHIEQGPILEAADRPVAVVDRINGRTYADVVFVGTAGHAGTTPMNSRRDAIAAAAEWIGCVEAHAKSISGLVATTGCIEADPGAANVIAGRCRLSLDVRHADNAARAAAVDCLRTAASEITARRGVRVDWSVRLDQPSTPMDATLVATLSRAVARAGVPTMTMSSGAGHDAMVLAPHLSATMLFIRTPGGVSHHPDESVDAKDVTVALAAGKNFLDELAVSYG